ncbi:MAG: RES domain-containing protein [Saprospiraceae bacterium]|nr:RES domain-containing protein [Saprospiraceae bacterium]
MYRITRTIYAGSLSGEGAKRFGGRWNHKGTSLIYTSAHISLAFLELLVNVDVPALQNDFNIIVIQIPDYIKIKSLDESRLDPDWRISAGDGSKDLGTQWCQANQEAVLAVPSAVIPFEYNYLLNPSHPDFAGFTIHKVLNLEIDARFKDSKSSV